MLKFEFNGKGSELFVLYLKNLILTVLTSGVYLFWASVNIRKYFYQHIALEGKFFDYHATGKEQFIGFIKFLLFLLVIILFFSLLFLFLSNLHPLAGYASPVLAGLFFLSLSPFLITASRKYNLSRSSYDGIRFYFSGKPETLFLILLKGLFFSVITLGIYYPFFRMNYHRFLVSNSALGKTIRFSFSGKGKDFLLFLVKGIFLIAITLGIYSFKFQAELVNFYWNRTFINGVPFRSSLRGSDLLIFFIKSFILIPLTFGIAAPWIAVSYSRLLSRKLELQPGIDIDELIAVEKKRIQDNKGSYLYDPEESYADPFSIILKLLNS